jgi:uncharacterized protein YjbI with pentapeptide repeats
MASNEDLAVLRRGVEEWNAWRNQTAGRPCDLTGADLSRTDLSEANLRHAKLSRAKLSGANLSGAHLRWADFSGAHLRAADLSGADLGDADLSRADLGDADLSGSDLSRANFSGASLVGANLSGADLSKARQLTRRQLDSALLDSPARGLSESLTDRRSSPPRRKENRGIRNAPVLRLLLNRRKGKERRTPEKPRTG